MRNLFCTLVVSLFFAHSSFTQLVVNPGVGTAGVSASITGPGITISNVTINCDVDAYGSFSGGTSAGMGISNGLMLTTGNFNNVADTNFNDNLDWCYETVANDPDLMGLEFSAVNDVCIIEFDVVPQCHNISITFVFGSDEYTNWVNQSFNDAFGFFVSGPDPAGGVYSNTNIATIPGNVPVTIDNVNHMLNSGYYVDNDLGTYMNSFDGFTVVLAPNINVVPCGTYHIKLAIADASDCAVDSGVLIDLVQCVDPWEINTTSTPANCGTATGTATATVTGDSGPYTYLWTHSGETTSTVTGLLPGTYTVTVNDALTCTPPKTDTVVVNNVIPVPPVGVTFFNNICPGESATLTATGGASYTWSPATGLSSTTGATVIATPTVTTAYTVTGTGPGGCGSHTAVSTVVVHVPPTVSVSSASICEGGSATLTATGATSYSWSPATGLSSTTGASVTANPTTTTVYTITGTDPFPSICPGTTTATVTVNPAPVITVPSISICTGTSGTLNATGATSYTWSPATGLSSTTGASVTANPTSNTTYTITGTTAGCSGTTTATVSIGSSLTITAADATICAGGSTTLTATGAPNYTWSPATGLSSTTGASVTANPTTTTTYTITGTDPSGCSGSTTVTVTVNPTPVINVPSISICDGSSGTLHATGATSYSWSPATGLSSTTGASVTAIPTTTTTYTIIGNNGSVCADTVTATVTVNPTPVINVPSISICPGSSGPMTATGASFYSWAPPTGLSSTTDSSIIAGPPGTTTYTITGTNGGCSGTTTATVTVASSLTINATDATICAGENTTLTATGATSYTWSPATGLSSATGASVTANPTTTTTYTITGTDPSGCSGTTTVTVTVNPNPDITATPASEGICDGQTTGINLSSTVAGTTFAWSVSAVNVSGSGNGTGTSITQTLNTITPPSGTATYTITPSTATCTGDPINVVINVGEITITGIDTTRVLCFGGSNGTITIHAPGATQYSINGGTSFQASNVFNVPAGTYNVVVQNTGGCQGTATAVVTQPAQLTAPVSSTNETCAGACNGIGGTAPSGGTAPYHYSWSIAGVGDVPFVNTLCSGTHTVTVTDASNCQVNASITISGPVGVDITATAPTQPGCFGAGNGSLTVTATGPTALEYSIDNGTSFQTSNIFNSLAAGTYQVVVRDTNGCRDNINVTIGEPAALSITAGNDLTICQGQNATITAAGSGGTAPYTISWSHGLPLGNSHTVIPGTTTTYNISLTDANGCGPVTESVIVTVHPPLSVTALSDQSICPGAAATISATGSGGNGGPYTYTWTNNINATTLTGAVQSVSPNVSTTYTVTVSDGCTTPNATDQVTITLLSLPFTSFTADTLSGCSPVMVNFSHAAAGANCSWNFGDGTTSNDCTPQHVFSEPGCYNISLTVTDANGCTSDTSVNNMICVFAIPVAGFTFGPVDADIFHPEVYFTNLTTGGSQYTWNFEGGGSSHEINPVYTFPTDSGGHYQVCLNTISNHGCIDSACHVVNIGDQFLLYVPNTFTPDGDGLNDIFLPVLQGEAPLTYELYIFNRWGELIFLSTDKLKGWDGTHKGIISKEDVYVWKLRVRKKMNQDKIERMGHINLLR